MKIALFGTFDVENYGDCLFPELWASLLRGRWPDATVELYSPTSRPAAILTERVLRSLPAVPGRPLISGSAGPHDAMVLCGGETLGVGHTAGTYIFPTREYSAYLRLWLSPIVLAAEARGRGLDGYRAVIHACGLAPIGGQHERLMARLLGYADRTALRDAISHDRLAAAIGEPSLTAAPLETDVDPMFTLDALLPEAGWRALARKHLPDDAAHDGYVAVQVSKTYLAQTGLADFADQISALATSAGKSVVLVPCCHFLDDEMVLAALEALLQARGRRTYLVRGRINVKATAAVLGGAHFVVSTSLHAAVTGIAFARPVTVLAHSMTGKHQGTLGLAGVEGAVTTRIGGLREALAFSRGIDLARRRREIGARVAKGLERAFAAIEGADRNRTPPDEVLALARELMACERAMVEKNRMLRLKRSILPVVRRFERLEVWRRRRRVARL